MKNILVAIDFKNNEKLLVDKAFQLALAFEAKLWVIHIAAPDPDYAGYSVGKEYVRKNRASTLRKEHRQLQEYSAKLEEKGVKATALLIQGSTIELIMEESKKLHIDLIIAGYHEHGFLYNAIMGSVSSQIIKKSKIPVLIVPLD